MKSIYTSINPMIIFTTTWETTTSTSCLFSARNSLNGFRISKCNSSNSRSKCYTQSIKCKQLVKWVHSSILTLSRMICLTTGSNSTPLILTNLKMRSSHNAPTWLQLPNKTLFSKKNRMIWCLKWKVHWNSME